MKRLSVVQRFVVQGLASLSVMALLTVGCGGGDGDDGQGGEGGGAGGEGGDSGGRGGVPGSGGGGSGGQGGGAGATPDAGMTIDAAVNMDGGGDAGTDGATPLPMLDPNLDLTLAYDSFDGPVGRLHGVGAGVGWSGQWVMQGENTTEQNLLADSLSYLDLATAAGRAAGAGYSSAGRTLATMDNGPFSNERTNQDLIGAPGKTVWVSFLVQKATADNAPVVVFLSRSNISWVPEDKSPLRVGFFGDASIKDGKRYWSMNLVNADGTGPGPTSVSTREVETGKTALIVLKLEYGATNTVSMFVNPTQLMTAAPATPDLTLTTTGPMAFRGLVFQPANNSQANHGSIDEVRIGRTFAAVTPRMGAPVHWAKPPQVTLPPNSNLVCNRVRIFARPRQAGRLLGAKIKGSNTGETTNFEDIGTLSYVPAEGAWTDYVFPNNTKAYRYVKLVSAPNGYVTVADVEFYGGTTRLTGRAFGSAGSFMNSGETFDKALDGNTSTFFVAPTASEAYVGYDLGTAETQVAAPTFNPAPGVIAADSVTVTIATTTPGATVKCTIDGSWPTPSNGSTCAGTTTFTKAQTPGGRGKLALRAIAYKDGLFDSAVTTGNYYLNFTGVDITTFHLGNSLTDTLNGHFAQISAAAGKDHTYHRCTVPGAPTEFLWDNENGGCLGVGSWKTVYETPARFGVLNHQTTQPFSGHGRSVANEGGYTLNFLAAARQGGASMIQHWLYGQWPDSDFGDNFSRARSTLGTGDAYPYAEASVNSYEKAALNHMAYLGSLKKAVDAGIAADATKYGAKPVKIIPGPLAMYALLKERYAGNLPNMLAATYEDGLHLTPRGAYYIGLLAYSAIFNESAEGKENSHHVTLGIPAEEAKALQKLAWDVWSAYSADPTWWPNAKP